MTTADDTRANGSVTYSDIEDLSLRVQQAVSTLAMLINCHEAKGAPNLLNAIALVTDHLGR